MPTQALSLFTFASLDRFYFYLIFLISPVLAAPINPFVASHFQPRQLVNPVNGKVFDPNGQDDIPQGSATDGGGTGFSLPAVLWIAFAVAVGTPLAFAGVRGWRFTAGIGIGLSLAILMWCAFVNTMSADMLGNNSTQSDLIVSSIVWASFIIGFGFGFIRIGTLAGVCLLGGSAGVALAILVVLLRPGLLFPIYGINLAPLAILACAGSAWPMWHQRLAIIVSSSANGSFLLALSADLIINKQLGMSRGLRLLLDRNVVHLGEITKNGYNPPMSTLIIVGVGIALIPVFSFAQHRLFRGPFDRSPESLEAYSQSLKGAPVLAPAEDDYMRPRLPKTSYSTGTGSGSTGLYTVPEDPPQHTNLRFPSIIPSLPGNVDFGARGGAYPQQMIPKLPAESVPVGGVIPVAVVPPVSSRKAFWNRVSSNFRFGGQAGRQRRQGSEDSASQYSGIMGFMTGSKREEDRQQQAPQQRQQKRERERTQQPMQGGERPMQQVPSTQPQQRHPTQQPQGNYSTSRPPLSRNMANTGGGGRYKPDRRPR